MTRQATDNLYIELDYFTPEDYYTYEADAEAELGSDVGFECVANTSATVSFEAALTSEFTTESIGQKLAGLSIALSSEFTQSATISHIEGADLFAFTEASIAVTVERIRDNNIAVTSVFDVGVDAVRIQQSDALASSAATLSATALRSKSLDSSMLAAFSLSVSGQRVTRFIGTPTVNSGTTFSTLAIDTSIKKFGAGSLRFDQKLAADSKLKAHISFPDYAGFDTWKTIDFWIYVDTLVSGTSGIIPILRKGAFNEANAETAWQLSYITTSNINKYYISIIGWDNSGNAVTLAGNNSEGLFDANAWTHVRIVNSASASSLYLNGVRLTNSQATGRNLPDTFRSNTAPLLVGGGSSTQSGVEVGNTTYRLDEILITDELLNDPSASTITVPTSPFENSTLIDALFHYDSNFDDDAVTILRNPGAVSMNSVSNVTINLEKLVRVSSAVSTTSTLTAEGNTVIEAEIAIAAMASQLTATAVNFDLVADLSTTATLSSTARKIVPLQAQVTAASTVSATALRIKRFNSAVSTVSTLAATVRQIKGSLPTTITARATLTASLKGLVQTGRANLNAVSTLSCDARVNLYPGGDFEFDSTLRSIEQFTPGQITYTIPEIGTQDFVLSFQIDFLPVRFYNNFSEPFPDIPRPEEIDRFLRIGNTTILNLEFNGISTGEWMVEDARSFIENDPTDIIWRQIGISQLINQGFVRITVLRKDGRLYLTLPGTVPTFPAANARDFNGIVYSRNLLGTTVSIGDDVFDQFGSLQTNGQWPFQLKDFYFEIDGEQVSPGTIASADLFTQAALSFEGIIVKFGEAELQSSAQLQANIGKIQGFSAGLNSAATISVDATKAIVESSALSSTATLNCMSSVIARVTANFAVESTLTANNTRVKFADTALQSEFLVIADNSRLRDHSADFSSEFAVNAEPLRIKTSAVSFESIATNLTAAAKIGDFLVTLESTSTVTAQAEYTARPVLELVSDSTVEVDSIVTVQGAADLVSESTAIISVDKVKPMGAELSSEFTQQATAVKITDITENFAANTDFAVAEQRIRLAKINVSSEFNFGVDALKARTLQANLLSESELLASVFNIVQVSAALESQGFVLIAGRVLQLDPYLTYVVAQETRYYTVAPESREFIINQETRTLKL